MTGIHGSRLESSWAGHFLTTMERIPRTTNRADTWGGRKKGPKHDHTMHECFYVLSKQEANPQLTIGTLVKWARDSGWVPKAVLEIEYAVCRGVDGWRLRHSPRASGP